LGSETFVSLTKRRLPVRHGDFVKPESFCTCVLKAKYYPNGMLEDTGFTGMPHQLGKLSHMGSNC
jgi:hypothetical protein